MAQLVVVKCPTDELALTNRAIVNKNAFGPEVHHVEIRTALSSYVFTICDHPAIGPGTVGLNAAQREWAALTLGQKVEMKGFPVNPDKDHLSNMVLELVEVPTESDKAVAEFLEQFSGQVFMTGQKILFYCMEKLLTGRIATLEALGGKASIGVVTFNTAVHFKPQEEYTFFWREESPFSQWYPCSFVVDGQWYNCAEQYMMHQKALTFGDRWSAKYILNITSPKDQKKAGRRVTGFNVKIWDSVSTGIVKKANLAKFEQNPALKKKLFDTRGTTMVETSPWDCVWGIGLKADDPKAKDRKQWRGKNKLGYILTEVREELYAACAKS